MGKYMKFTMFNKETTDKKYHEDKHTGVEPRMVLKHKFWILLQKILRIYDSIILEFSLSYNQIYCFETLRP